MTILPQNQLSLAEIYSDCPTIFETDKHQFLFFLEENINLDDYIPLTFHNNYYASNSRPLEHHLSSMLGLFFNVFFQFLLTYFYLLFYSFLKNSVSFVAFFVSPMLLDLLVSSKTLCWTYSRSLIILLM